MFFKKSTNELFLKNEMIKKKGKFLSVNLSKQGRRKGFQTVSYNCFLKSDIRRFFSNKDKDLDKNKIHVDGIKKLVKAAFTEMNTICMRRVFKN